MPFQVSEQVLALARQAEQGLGEQFARIDAIAQHNTQRVLSAFQDHRVAEGYFAGTTGYGYDDLGREQLDLIYAQLFGTEDALVRIGFVNGTHAISSALFSVLRPGDTLVSAVGERDARVAYPRERWMSTARTLLSRTATARASRSGVSSGVRSTWR